MKKVIMVLGNHEFYSKDKSYEEKLIEKLIKLKIPSSIAEGFELDPNIVPEQAKKKKNSSQKNSNKRSGKSRNNKRRFKR